MRPLLIIACWVLASCAAPSPSTNAPVSSPCVPCPQAPSTITAIAAAPRTQKLDQLAQQRVELARKQVQLARAEYARGNRTLLELLAAWREIAFAARDSGLRGEALRQPLQDYRDAINELRELTRVRVARGASSELDMNRIESAVAESEYWLAEAAETR